MTSMTTYTQYCIPLKKSVLIFLPACPSQDNEGNSTANYVVQVMIRQAYRDMVKELTAFFLSQFEITKAIESIAFAHIVAPLPEEVLIEGNGYILRGKRKPWVYGKTLDLGWGEQSIKPCADKWTFVFETPEPR